MIILKSEIYSRFPVNKDFKYDLHEVISCSDCKHRIYAHGQCKRKVYRDKFGEKNKEPEIHHLLVIGSPPLRSAPVSERGAAGLLS
jgi:hypothetical protein